MLEGRPAAKKTIDRQEIKECVRSKLEANRGGADRDKNLKRPFPSVDQKG